MADWLVAVAEYQREERVGEKLSTAGLNSYQPIFRERRFLRGRRIWRDRYLLGRYVLVEAAGAALCELASIVKGVRYVCGILSADERPLVARGVEVDRLRSSEVRGRVPIELTQPRRGAPGKIFSGMFAGHVAQFDKRDDERGVDRILVEAFGQLTPLEIPTGAWEAT